VQFNSTPSRMALKERDDRIVGGSSVSETVEEVLREYIDFINEQVGVYMDALAGFEGHYTRVERQIFRESRLQSSRIGKNGVPETVWASYEDPTKPDIIHNRIIRTGDYLAANSKGGSNEQQHSKAILLFLFTFWEEEIRPRLAAILNIDAHKIKSDIMGDLRILRNAILHSRGILRTDKYRQLKKLSSIFGENAPIRLSYENMHQVFVLMKQDCARMFYEFLGITDPKVNPDEIVDLAIQFPAKKKEDS